MLGEILGAAGSLIGGLFGQNKADKAAKRQEELQREFAQNAIQWKVKDATAAGIHPLYALGANTTSYQPVSVGGADFANIGQNVGRAMDIGRSSNERASAFDKTVQALTLEKMGLENQILASQLRTVNQPGHPPAHGPGRMIPGQGQTMESPALTVNVNPKNTPAQEWENQYGEIAGGIAGLPALLDDWLTTKTGASSPADLGRNLRQLIETHAPNYLPQLPKRKRLTKGNRY